MGRDLPRSRAATTPACGCATVIGVAVASGTKQATPPSTDVPVLRLNLLPVSFPLHEKEVVYSFPRDDALNEELREQSGRGEAFHTYTWGGKIYVWAHSGQTFPDTLDLSSADSGFPSTLPAGVLCFAVRDAVVDRLVDTMGFERVGRRAVEGQIQLFRRKLNLAADALAGVATATGQEIGPETGVFPYLGVQCIPFGDRNSPGKVAVVLDAGIVNRLDVSLGELSRAGIDLNDVRVVWDHGEHCSCGYEDHHGPAGRIVGGDPSAAVEVANHGERMTIPAGCLRLLASRQEIDRYFTQRLSSNRNVEKLIADRVVAFHEADTQWKMLERARVGLSPITVFTSTEVTLEEPVVADAEGSQGATLLPSLPEEPELNFQFGAPVLFQGAASGLNRHGPYDKNVTSRLTDVRATVLYPAKFKADGERLRRTLVDGVARFPGLQDRYDLNSLSIDSHMFSGETAADYSAAAAELTRPARDGTLPNLVFLVTQQSDRNRRSAENPYLAAKAVLANADVPSQALTVEKIRLADSAFTWVIQSVALQAYAKVGNIPFVLHDVEGEAVNELILGIGRHDLHLPGKGYQNQLFGAAAAFRQDGDFLFAGSTVPVSDRNSYEQHVRTLVSEFIDRYEKEQGKPLQRVIVHLFKKTGPKEVNALKGAIGSRQIDFALVHVNRDTPLWLVDDSSASVSAAAIGTVVELGPGDRLLMTGEHGTGKKRNPHPLRLTLDRESTFTDMDRITRQAQGFTATSWRGFRTTYEPSTILYGRLLAEKVAQLLPHGFDPTRAIGIGGKPWFL